MATTLPPYSLVRASTPAELVNIFRPAVDSPVADELSQHLLSGVVQGSISPGALRRWIDVSRSPNVIKLALQQNQSLAIRDAGIKQFGKNLTRTRWRETWDGLGGVPGLLDLFSDLSVLEVQFVCRTILRSIRGSEKAEKQERISQLLTALLPAHFSHNVDVAPLENPDGRPLGGFYEGLFRICPPRVVELLLQNADVRLNDLILREKMAQQQIDVLRPFVLRAIFDETATWNIKDDPLLLLGFLQKWPSAPGHEPNLSASMQFSLDLLRRLASSERSLFPDELFISGLVEPLVKRCRRRRADWTQVLEIVKLAAGYLSRFPTAARNLSFLPDRLINWVAQSWSRQPAEFEGPLKVLIRNAGKDVGVSSFMFPGIPRALRYPLFRLGFIATGQGDLDNDSDLERMRLQWSFGAFEMMETEHAWRLYKRTRAQKESFLGFQPIGEMDVEDRLSNDKDVLLSSLLHRKGGEAEAVDLATKRVESYKKKSMSSNERTERSNHARRAMSWAAESASLKLYKEAQLWARRFIRDPLTVPDLFQRYEEPVLSLLSGRPRYLAKGVHTVSHLRARVVEANEVLWILMESLLVGLREPSFNSLYWSGTADIFNDVVYQRLGYSKCLKKTLGFSDDEIYEILWEDTLPLLIKAEKVMLQPGHERLNRNNVHGVLGGGKCGSVVDALPSTYRFFDELAKARDEVWREYRPTVVPAAASIPAPYARGLPIQHLTGPFNMRASPPEALTPYIAARAREVLFLDPALAFTPYPQDKETQAVIGKFVDCYEAALRIYVPSTLPDEEKKKRVEQVWAHAVGPLSEGRMSADEAFRYWRSESLSKVVKFWPDEHAESPDAQLRKPTFDPRIPPVEDSFEVVEWNPLPPELEPIEPRKLEPTYIDFAKSINYYQYPEHMLADPLQLLKDATIPGVPADRLYSTLSVSATAPREAKVLLHLLYLDANNTAPHRILHTPFPSPSDLRYPSIYLDEAYLSKEKDTIRTSLAALKPLAPSIPPPLLLQLTQNSLEAMANLALAPNAAIDVSAIAYTLLALLTRSDHPALAIPLAIHTIIANPDSSSWHRQILSRKFLRRLSASQARACVTSFADAVISKLETPTTDQDRPAVKVTTVKYLAQLLDGAEYVAPGVAIGILQALLRAATHTDIRTAVLGALLSALSATNHAVNEAVLGALEALVPLIGSPNGRGEVGEETWRAAEHDLAAPLPEMLARGVPPLLGCVTDFLEQRGGEEVWRGPLVGRVVLPAVELLRVRTRRWLAVFLARHGAGEVEVEVPDVPGNRYVWKAVLESGVVGWLPARMVEEVGAYEAFYVGAFSEGVGSVVQRIRADAALKESEAGKYFLTLVGAGSGFLAAGFDVRSLLGRGALPARRGEITVEVARGAVMGVWEALLRKEGRGNGMYGELGAFVAGLRPPVGAGEDGAAWTVNTRPVVEEMVARVEAMRTEAWKRNVARVPEVLPDTFEWQLWLLPWPGMGEAGGREERCRSLADWVTMVLEWICGEGVGVYHGRFGQVKSHVGRWVDASEDRCLVAVHLGQVSRKPGLVERLRLELAESLLSGAEGVRDRELWVRVDEMVEAWTASYDEEVRRTGCGLLRRWRAFQYLGPH